MMLIIYRSDVVLAVFFAVLFGALVISSYLTLYLRYYWISFVIICIGVFLPWRLRITRQALARKKERLLPLSFWSVTLVPQIWLSGLTNCIPRTYYAMGFTWTLRNSKLYLSSEMSSLQMRKDGMVIILFPSFSWILMKPLKITLK